MLPRNRFLVTAATLCAALTVPAAAASAEDFCVDNPAGCEGTPLSAAQLKSVLSLAQTNGTDDRFLLAPGVFEADKFTYESAERVQLIGAGAGKTVLRGNAGGSVLELHGDPGTSVSELTLEARGAASGGLTLKGTSAHRVAVDATQAASLFAAVNLHGTATFDDGNVDIGSLARNAVVVSNGNGRVTDSTLIAREGVGFGSAATDATLARSTVDAKVGVTAVPGHATVSDTFIDLRGHGGAVPAMGLHVIASVAAPAAKVDAERLTIVGSTPDGTETKGVVVAPDVPGLSAELTVRDSVMDGIGVPLSRQATNGATANLTVVHSAVPTGVATHNTGLGSTVVMERLAVSPRFIGDGDFHLAPDSPLIDAGSSDALPADATDRDGRARVADGNGDCQRVHDVGAFEYEGKVTAVAATAAVTAAVGQALAFSAAGSCIPGAGEPRVSWTFDDGASADGTTVTHAFATPGRHSATVTIADGDGHRAQASVTVDIEAPPETSTPPEISDLRVAPRRVRIGRLLPKLVTTAVKQPGATIRFTLSEDATVRLHFAKLRKSGKPRSLKTRIRFRAHEGLNRIRFAARLNRKVRLDPGAYKVTVVAIDADGARSGPARARFRVARA